MKWVPRLGLLSLLVALAAFEMLFVAERTRGHEALAAERALRSTRATELLHEELQRQFDVADTRLEALETLPLLEEDGLLWIREGVQRFPRVAGALKGDETTVEALGKFIDGDEHALDALTGAAGSLSSAVKKKGSAQDRLFRAWPWLERRQAAELCARAQRVEPRDTELVARCQRALAGVEVKLPALPTEQLVLVEERWLVRASQTESADARDGAAGSVLREPAGDGANFGRPAGQESARDGTKMGPQTGGFGADAGRQPDDVANEPARGDANVGQSARDGTKKGPQPGGVGADAGRQPDDVGNAPATDGTKMGPQPGGVGADAGHQPDDVRPQPSGNGAGSGREVRGVELKFDATLTKVTELLARRAVLEPGETVTPTNSGNVLALAPALPHASPPPLTLTLISPRLDTAEAALTSAFWWKSALLALTALLGVAVVLLMRLAEARERATLALQRDFISTVSHELRTPLAGIRVLAETLERKLGVDPSAPTKDYPKRLVAAVDGLGFLVENILSFNRIEAGRVQPKLEPFPLSALEPMLREDIALMLERPVTLELDAGLSALGALDADVTLLRILVLNLLRNAWKYSPRDAPKFTVRGRAEGHEVVLTFSDDGPGIPAAAHERVFEPFHRQPEATKQGSGLGLALARRIAQLHGGTLRITASSSEGTTFELRLPRSA